MKEPNGLLAAGGDLSPERLLDAYQKGIFPWFSPGEPILWWSPDPRCVLFCDDLYLSRSMRKRLRKDDFTVTFDRAFEAVIHACSEPRGYSDDTWISQEMKQAYTELHKRGIAHSVEVWQNNELAGGLYGLGIGQLFFGESMFSRQRDASKIAFAYLVEQLKKWGYPLIDCQVHNDHLVSLGACEIPRTDFKHYLNQYLDRPVSHNWEFDDDLCVHGGSQ